MFWLGGIKGQLKDFNEPEFILGNPIDIIGDYIYNKDFFSCDEKGEETNEMYHNRRLNSCFKNWN